MATRSQCPTCGANLPGDAPGGECAVCLFQLGFLRDAAEGQSVAASNASSHPPDPAQSPAVLGDYVLLEEIGRGGMGVVYKARHQTLGRIVALKRLQGAETAPITRLARFLLEAKTAAQLDHPHIVPIHETGEWDGQPWFSMKFIEGQSLAHRLRDCRLAPTGQSKATGPAGSRARQLWIARLLATVARAVHYAHQHGVLHRDLKPSNILLDTQDQPYLTDFGIAKLVQEEADLTLTAEMLGTPHYVAPEQATAKEVTVAADLYSLGAILYEVLSGRPVFEGRTTLEILRQVVENEPPRLRTHQKGVDSDLETICLKCLEKEPARRYPNALALAEDLERFLSGAPIEARPVGRPERLWRWCRRRPALAGALAVSLLLFASGLTGVFVEWQRAERHAAAETEQRQRAEKAVEELEVERAEDMLQSGRASLGLAYLARVLRQDPSNRVAATRLLSALTQRSFALPLLEVTPPTNHASRKGFQVPAPIGIADGSMGQLSAFSADGTRMVMASGDRNAWVFALDTGRLALPALTHESVVSAAAFSRDGRRLATASKNGSVHLWDAATGQPLGPPLPHPDTVHGVEFSPDGLRLLSISADQTVRFWDVNNGQPLAGTAPLQHGATVLSAHFSPDAQRVVTTTADGQARVWDALTGQPMSSPLRHQGAVIDAQFSPDGNRVATASEDQTARVWMAQTGQPLTPPMAHRHKVLTARFSQDGVHLVTASTDQTVRLWDALTGSALGQLASHRHWVSMADFSPDGQRILSASYDTTAQIHQAFTGQTVTEPLRHGREVVAAQFNSTGQQVVTASLSGQVRLWDIQPGQALVRRLRHNPSLRSAEWSPDSRWVVTASVDGTARVWEADTGQPVGEILRHGRDVWNAQFSPDSQRVATASWDGTVQVWDAKTGQPQIKPIHQPGYARRVCFSPEGDRLATGGYDGTARVWDARTGEPLSPTVRHNDQVWEVQFSPDGNRIVTASWDGTARIWDARTGEPLTGPLRHEGNVVDASFSPDGRRVLTAAYDGTARIWDSISGRPATPPLRHGAWLSQARFSPDGGRVVTASSDGTARIWDAISGRPLAKTLGHQEWVTDAVFSPDGRQVATASWDGTARIWDAETGQPLGEPLLHNDQVKSVRFSPDGRSLLTASWDGTACLGEVAPTEVPVPDWFPALAEAIGGERLDAQRSVTAVRVDELTGLRQQILARAPNDAYTRWAHWFFANRASRPVSPGSSLTTPQYVEDLLKLGTVESLREALLILPTNGTAFARLAMTLLKQNPTEHTHWLAEAAWCSRRALALSPLAADTWQARVQVRAYTNDLAQTARLLSQASTLPVQEPQFWNDWGLVLQEDSRPQEALEAFGRAIHLAQAHPDSVQLTRSARLNRARLLNQMGRPEEASAENLAALGIPPRDPLTQPRLLDLSPHYNGGLKSNWAGDHPGNNLAELPAGRQNLSGMDFDVRGLIQLAGQRVPQFPIQVTNIQVGMKCRRLCFLHSAITAMGFGQVQIGSYLLHYEDGQTRELPIRLGAHLLDWWQKPASAPANQSLEVAWEGTNEKSRPLGSTIRLFKTTWDNPLPDLEVRRIDFISKNLMPAPFLVAITLE